MPICAACNTALPDGANFCFACGRSLRTPTEPASARRGELRAYTPPHLIDKILTSRAALEGERKLVTVLFADVKGSMEIAEGLDPEEWHQIMDRFFAILADGVHRFEGTVNQFTGDGIMALFGAPIAHEDHAQRACHAALLLREALRGYAHQLRRERGLDFAVRIGLNSGEVVVGRIGDDLRMDYTAQGHTVGLASRMEQLAEAGGVYVTEHTASLASGFFQFADLGLFTVKGVREALRVYALQGVGELRTRFDLSRARGLSRFVGRTAERALLDAALQRAGDGAAPVVAVVAEPGTGKSRLCFEFLNGCRERGGMVLDAHGLAHARLLPFTPVRELLRQLFGIAEEDEARVAREKIAGRLLLLDPALRELLPLVFEFLGAAAAGQAEPSIDAGVRQQHLVDIVRRVVADGDRPAVLLLEDLHWLDQPSEDFLRALIDALSATRALLILSFRPEYAPAWLPASRTTTLPLPPLDDAAIGDLLRDLLGDDPALGDLAERIRARTGGNPFFIEEMVNGLVERGTLRGGRGAYTALEPGQALTLPATVEVVLAGRLDRVGEPGKTALQTAAVIGRQFDAALLQRATGIPARELRAVLRSLSDADFIYAEGRAGQYAFKHALTQEVAEHSQLAGQRAARHAAVAQALEASAPERLHERAALIATHWEHAGEPLRASKWYGRAADGFGRSDPRQSLDHWRRAHALLRAEPAGAERDRLLVIACTRLMEVGAMMAARTESPDALYDEARGLADRIGDPGLTARLLAIYATARALSGWVPQGMALSEEATRLAERSGDVTVRIDVAYAALFLYDWQGEYRYQLDVCERMLALVQAHPDLGLGGRRGRLLVSKGAALAGIGRMREGAVVLREALALAEQSNDVELMGLTSMESAWLEHMRGDNEVALQHAERAVRCGQQLGSGAIVGPTMTLMGALHGQLGSWATAVSMLETIVALVRDGRRTFEPIVLAYLAEAYLGAGDVARARATAEGAVEAARRHGTRGFEARARMAQAHVILREEGAAAQARLEALWAEIDDLIAETGARSFAPHVCVRRAELAELLGDTARRERELRAARALFAEMDGTAMVAKLDALLA